MDLHEKYILNFLQSEYIITLPTDFDLNMANIGSLRRAK